MPGAVDSPILNAFSRPGAQEDDAHAQASCIFSDVVSMRIKPAARDEYVAAVTVRLRPDNAVHPRSLLLELTDESDLFFYHSLLLGEGDFHTLKSEQRLLVDFQSFPLQLVELLRRCMESPEIPSLGQTATSHITAASGTTSLRMLACLDCGSGGESVFNIIESNQFRELTYIGLRLRQGTDETVKKHLAAKLRLYRTESIDLAERLRLSEELVGQLYRQAEELTTRARIAGEERTHLEQSLNSSHQREVAEIRQEHARAVVDFQQTSNQERSRVEADLQQAVSKMTARAETAERLNEELQKRQLSLTSSGETCRERLDASESQLQETKQEMKVLREQQKQLELLKYQHEREIGERNVHLSSLKEQLLNKEQLVTNQASQLEQGNSQRKNVEESLAMCKQQVSSLEEKFGLTTSEIAKGNQIIQKLRTDGKQLKAKLRLKVEALTQQEKSVFELERSEETGRHMVQEKAQEVLRSKEREERQRQDIEDLKKKLAEAHEVLRSNHDVIEYLNRQLTERDLKSLPNFASGFAGESGRETRGNALTDLLKRTEALSNGPKFTELKAGSGLSPNSTNFNFTGLSELGLGSLSSAGFPGHGLGSAGQASSLLNSGLAAPGNGAGVLGGATAGSYLLGNSGISSAAAAANEAAARYPLSGPVTYRNPATTSPIAVK